MTNLYILLTIGGCLGWMVAALLPARPGRPIVALLVAGCVGAFAAGLISNDGTLYRALSALSIVAAMGGALTMIGLWLIGPPLLRAALFQFKNR